MSPCLKHLITLALLLVAVACSPGDSPVNPAHSPPATLNDILPPPILPGSNIVLITLDTTRADALGVYGAPDWVTPNLDRLARDGVRFQQARATAPTTLPSHTSILTGTYPFENGVRDNGSFLLPDSAQTLTEQLAEAGYHTAAVMGSFVLHSSHGLNQGFDVYSDVPTRNLSTAGGTEERRAGEVVTEALRLISAAPADRPFFLWLHFFDPHWPYSPPDDVLSRLPQEAQPGRARDPRDAARRAYFAEVAGVDRHIGRLVKELDARHGPGNTLLAVVADHGEGLGQHAESSHAYLVYDSTMRVPMILNHRALAAGTVIQEPVSTVDLPATLLGLLEEAPLPAGSGLDLSSSILPGNSPDARLSTRPVYMETAASWLTCRWSPLYAIVEGPWKTIIGPEPELFRYLDDPDESQNLAASHPKIIQQAGIHLADFARRTAESSRRVLTAADARSLEALGYIQAENADQLDPLESEVPPGWIPEGARHPREGLPREQNLNQANSLLQSGRTQEGVEILRELVRQEPDNVMYLSLAGALLTNAGRPQEALPILERAVARGGGYEARSSLAASLNQMGRHAEAITVHLGTIEQFPYQLLPRIAVAQILLQAGEPQAAIPHLEYFLTHFKGAAAVRSDAEKMLRMARAG
jgi:choline-sulfatase